MKQLVSCIHQEKERKRSNPFFPLNVVVQNIAKSDRLTRGSQSWSIERGHKFVDNWSPGRRFRPALAT